jgi:outer membrane protein assembly factor BamB
VVANGVVYIGSFDTFLYAFDAVSGKALWSGKLGASVSSSTVAVADGVIYVGSNDHKLYAFHLAQTVL